MDGGAGRRAYVFYATDSTYGIAVLVFVHQLRRLGVARGIELIVLHLPLPAWLLAAMRSLGIETRAVGPLRRVKGARYYRDCLIKLRALALAEYERIVYVDADAAPLRRLDFLFTLPLEAAIAAPEAYWLPSRLCTSALLVGQPQRGIWERIERRLESLGRERPCYDMDALNLEFGGEIERLPRSVFTLDSEWEDADRPGWLGDPGVLRAEAAVVHFTALGKPWSHSPARTLRLRPRAHPAFHELREAWWRAREEVFAGAPIRARLVFACSKRLSQLAGARRLLEELHRSRSRAAIVGRPALGPARRPSPSDASRSPASGVLEDP